MNQIKWAPRVSRDKIRRLYANDANGTLDRELLMEVGVSFLARADSVIQTNRIHLQHIASCPACQTDVPLCGDVYACACGWTVTQKELHLTYKGKQFIGPSIVGFAEKFIADWNAARNDPSLQMRAIDYLIHRFHWEMTDTPTRPVAINYIDGRLEEVKRLILELAYSGHDGQQENLKSWLKNREISQSIWGKDKQRQE